MDVLDYYYQTGTNRLDYVTDEVPDFEFDHDIDSQTAGNYEYDATGNLISDQSEELLIYWTPSGKISKIVKDDGNIIRYLYDHTGNRVLKTIHLNGNETAATFYVNDAQGNIMATYSRKYDPFILNPPLNYYLEEQPLYGTGRLGVRSVTKYLVGQINQGPLGGSFIAYPSDYNGLTGRTIGLKQYELTDHLGNVRVVYGDRLAFFSSYRSHHVAKK